MSGSHPTDKLLNIITHSRDHGSPNSSIIRSSEHCRANDDGDWVCENPDSDNNGVWTDYDDCCEDYEER